MKKTIPFIIVAGIGVFGCSQKSEREKESTSMSAQESTRPKPAFAAPDSFKVGLGKVFEGYTNIESALAHDNFAQAKDAFQSMHTILHILQTDGLDSSGKVYWDSLDGAIMGVLHPMAAAENISGMRDHFIDFTPLILDAVEKFGASSEIQAYLFHCPMARNKKGADWLQRDTVLLNPYYGNSMPTCGALVREVKFH